MIFIRDLIVAIRFKMQKPAIQLELDNTGDIRKRYKFIAELVVEYGISRFLDFEHLQEVRIPKVAQRSVPDTYIRLTVCDSIQELLQF